MEDLLVALLTNPSVRVVIESIVVKVVAEIIHRRNTDPEYLRNSDAVFALLTQAKTDEEKIHAAHNLSLLLSSQ